MTDIVRAGARRVVTLAGPPWWATVPDSPEDLEAPVRLLDHRTTPSGARVVPSTVVVTANVHGPPQHGVVRYARRFAAALSGLPGVEVTVDDGRADAGTGPLLVHVTDSLAIDGRQVWADRVLDRLVAWRGLRVVHLHDVPTPRCPPDRVLAYGRVAGAADVVVVCSDVEAERVRRSWGVPAQVVPHLPGDVEALDATRARAHLVLGEDPVVAVLGHVYPGKGHASVLRAVARVRAHRPRVRVRFLGRAARGHDGLVADLRRQADALGVPLDVTGWIDDDELPLWLAAVDVPVVANDGTAASGTLADWTGAGRVPLVRATAYAREVASNGDELVLWEQEGLERCVRRAVADPSSTRRGRPTVVAPPHELGELAAVLRARQPTFA